MKKDKAKAERLKKDGRPKGAAKETADPKVEQKGAAKVEVVERPTVEMLPCTLTDKEIVMHAQEAAKISGDISSLQVKKKNAAADFKTRIDSLQQRLDELQRKISGRVEDRQVKCVWRIDYTAKTKVLIRLDTKEEIRTLPLTPDELQGKLPLAETKSDRVVKTAEELGKRSEGDGTATGSAPADADNLHGPKASDLPDTPEAETDNEKKIRLWWNGMDKPHKKELLAITEESETTAGLLSLPYRKLKQEERELVRAKYREVSEGPAEEKAKTTTTSET